MDTATTPATSAPATDPAADDVLVGRVLGGDLAAFELLMRRHNQKLYRAVRAILRDVAEVEDVMQDTYLAAFKHLAQFQGRAQFSTWLLKIGMHEGFARLRRQVPIVALDESVDSLDSMKEVSFMNTTPARSPEEQASQHQMVDLVEAALDRLPAEQRQILVLRGVESLDTSEVAEVLGLSEAAVEQRLHRARVMLQMSLAGQVDGALSSAFGFLGSRCDAVVARVMRAITPPASGACTDCGAFSDLHFGDRFICESCYIARGSCCTEFVDDPKPG